MRSTLLLYLLTSIFVLACRQAPVSQQTTFPYQISVTAPQEYPVEVYVGYFSDGKDFITAIPKNGAEFKGWINNGANSGISASRIPSFMELTWISYGEKKFWKVATPLPKDTILALFREGYMALGREPEDPLVHKSYDEIVIGVAPGGIVVLWLDAGVRRVEVGRYQADSIWVDKDKFLPIAQKDETESEFFEWYYNHFVPDVEKEKIEQRGIPYGLWDKYRKKYLWRFNTLFYKPDIDNRQYTVYFNGEASVLYQEELDKKQPFLQPIPSNATLVFGEKNAEPFFDEEEITTAFEELTKGNLQEPLEIVGKVGFMYKDMTFSVKSKKKEIPLKKVKVDMYSNK